MFEKTDRYLYGNSQLTEVICQLRFPTILNIGASEPVELQEAVRSAFPQYLLSRDQPAHSGVGTEPPPTVTNYHFVSDDGYWRLNLTHHFIALTCREYTCWEEFARMLDQPLAEFIRIYRPAYFQRVGLRYLNAISRKALGVEDKPWSGLINATYLGLLGEGDLQERHAARCTQQAELTIPGGCRVKIHTGPALLRKAGQPEDQEVKFILDFDLSMSGSLSTTQTAPVLQTLHLNSTPIFRGSITEVLHEAMEPTLL